MRPLGRREALRTGYDTVDVESASELGIWVSNAPAGLTGNAISVAEFAVMLLIGAARHLGPAVLADASPASAVAGERRSLFGKTVCIVGLGTIGRHLVERLRPFGVTLIGTSSGTVAYLTRMVERWGDGIKPESILNAPAHPRRSFSPSE